MKTVSALSVVLCVAILVGCGVRDTSEDNVNNGSGIDTDVDVQTNSLEIDSESGGAIGSDTSAIAGFWDPGFNLSTQLYVLIDKVGRWSYVREDSQDNCFNVSTHTLTKNATDLYTLNESGTKTEMNARLLNELELRIQVLSDTGSVVIYNAVVNIMPQDLQICTS